MKKFHNQFIRMADVCIRRSNKAKDFELYVKTLEQDLESLEETLALARVEMYLGALNGVMELLALDLTKGLPPEEEVESLAILQACERVLRGYRCGSLPKRV
jgi:hypothetical protein